MIPTFPAPRLCFVRVTAPFSSSTGEACGKWTIITSTRPQRIRRGEWLLATVEAEAKALAADELTLAQEAAQRQLQQHRRQKEEKEGLEKKKI